MVTLSCFLTFFFSMTTFWRMTGWANVKSIYVPASVIGMKLSCKETSISVFVYNLTILGGMVTLS